MALGSTDSARASAGSSTARNACSTQAMRVASWGALRFARPEPASSASSNCSQSHTETHAPPARDSARSIERAVAGSGHSTVADALTVARDTRLTTASRLARSRATVNSTRGPYAIVGLTRPRDTDRRWRANYRHGFAGTLPFNGSFALHLRCCAARLLRAL